MDIDLTRADKAQTHLQPFARGYLPKEAYNYHSYMGGAFNLSKAEAKRMARRFQNDIVWMNDLYQVNVSHAGDFVHLSIKRRDKAQVHDWRDLQAIKDMLVGPEHEGLELYPRAARVVDTANQYHLWVLKNPKGVIPVGFPEGLRLTQDEARDGTPGAAFAVQRPFTEAADHAGEAVTAAEALRKILAIMENGPIGDHEYEIAEIIQQGLGLVPAPADDDTTTTNEGTTAP